jgi:3-deoxy-D-manno-octulosonic-acid transferase
LHFPHEIGFHYLLLYSFFILSLVLIIYDIGIWLLSLAMHTAALFNKKARLLVHGRKNWKKELSAAVEDKSPWIWFHCASLGEFEQGRPLMEVIKKQYPQYKILLTFYSSSGYAVRRNYEYADAVLYMPADTKANAAYFVRKLNPALAVFVKYEFWYHHLNQLHLNGTKTILISAVFHKNQPFFKWYGGLFRKMLHFFAAIFVQDKKSANLLAGIGVKENIFISGDTRYDRVAEIAANVQRNDVLENFLGNKKALIAGSTWPADEKIIKECLTSIPGDWKIIIAPHEIDQPHLDYIQELFGRDMIFYSQLKNDPGMKEKRILVMDNIGMLSALYSYGTLAYVGGGFQKGGIHNILEPAVYGLPVIFGPVYKKFTEAVEMKDRGFAFPVNNAAEYSGVLKKLIDDENSRKQLHHSLRQFMQSKTGATHSILQFISNNNWL